MAFTVQGYFTIDELAHQLEYGTKEHLGKHARRYGHYQPAHILQPDASTYFWGSEDLERNLPFFRTTPELSEVINTLFSKGMLDEYFGEPKMAVTVSGTILGDQIMQTNAVDLQRAVEISNGLGIAGPQKQFLVWNYLEGSPHMNALEQLWIPDRNEKLIALQQARTGFPPR